MVFPWFAAFYSSVPPMSSPASQNGLGFPTFSTKSLVYFVGFNLVIPSSANLIAGLSGVAAGILIHYNAFWVKNWNVVPGWLSSLCYK